MNPYAAFLGNGLDAKDPRDVIGTTAARLDRLLQAMSPERAEQPRAPGKWSARAILGHLADCEVVFAVRLRQAIAEDHHVIQPFDQDKFAAIAGPYGIAEALATFTTVRNWNLVFIDALPPPVFGKQLTHPERGTMQFQTLVETMAGHDLNHLEQLDSVAAHD